MPSKPDLISLLKKPVIRWLNVQLVYKLAIVVLIVLLTISITGYTLITQTQQTLTIQTEEEIRQNTNLQQTQIDNWLATTNREVLLVTDSQSINPENTQLNSTLKNQQTKLPPSVTNLHYYNTSENTPTLIATTNTPPNTTEENWTPQLNDNSLDTTDITRSSPYKTTTTNDGTYSSGTTRNMAFVTPDPDNPNHRLVVEINLQKASSQLRPLPDGRSYVINKKGTIILSSNPQKIGDNIYSTNTLPKTLANTVFESRSTFDTTSYEQDLSINDVSYAVGLASLNNADWIVTSQLPHSSAFAIEQNITNNFIPFILAITTSVLFAAISIGGPAIHDQNRLKKITQNIRDQNFDINIPSWREDDYGELYDHLDEMRNSLRLYINEIDELNREIQTSVEQQSAVMDAVSDGDLTQQMPTDNNIDDLDNLAANFNIMVEDVRSMVGEIRQSENELQNFLFIATHDLREPLRMIDTYIDLLEYEYSDELDEEAEEYMEIISGSATRINAMIEDLYTYLNARTHPDEFTSTNLNTITDEATEDLKPAIEEHNADITVESLPTVSVDEERMEDVFEHLIGNAIQYSPEDKQPIITVDSHNNDRTHEHILTVSDNGIGIPEEQHEKVFEIFSRMDRTENSESTGIGLAIVKRIIEDHGGRIWISSSTGDGTTFHIALPYEPQRSSTDFQLGEDKKETEEYRNDLERRLDADADALETSDSK